jgi:RimJ/RimL family protein N-acetyltransferase
VNIRTATIRAKRLELRPVRVRDSEAFFEHARIPEVAENAGFLPKSISETRQYLRRSAAEWRKAKPERMTFSIVLKPGAVWIGSLELRWLYQGVAEIGFFIHPRLWGNGFATEAGKAALDWAFRHGAHRVQGSCWTKNVASIRALRRLGMRKEGRLRGYAKVGDGFQDDFLFGVTLLDWRRAHRGGGIHAKHRRSA